MIGNEENGKNQTLLCDLSFNYQVYSNVPIEEASPFQRRRRPINDPSLDSSAIRAFHSTFPGYKPTRLVSLPDLAHGCNVRGVYLKDESERFGLPAFKVLGASWGAFNAVASKLNLTPDTSREELSAAARKASIRFFAATDGNHGRAVAFVARMLTVPALIYVPSTLEEHVKETIRAEGATVVVSTDYDGAVKEAATAAAAEGGILIQDTSYPNYQDIPARIVEGYSTMLSELDVQLQEQGHQCSLIICPVGVGSLAEAVTRHYKSHSNRSKVVCPFLNDKSKYMITLKVGSAIHS